jgi:hypothetical protein
MKTRQDKTRHWPWLLAVVLTSSASAQDKQQQAPKLPPIASVFTNGRGLVDPPVMCCDGAGVCRPGESIDDCERVLSAELDAQRAARHELSADAARRALQEQPIEPNQTQCVRTMRVDRRNPQTLLGVVESCDDERASPRRCVVRTVTDCPMAAASVGGFELEWPRWAGQLDFAPAYQEPVVGVVFFIEHHLGVVAKAESAEDVCILR